MTGSLLHKCLIVLVNVEELYELKLVEVLHVHHHVLPHHREHLLAAHARVAKGKAVQEVDRYTVTQSDQISLGERMPQEVVLNEVVELGALQFYHIKIIGQVG